MDIINVFFVLSVAVSGTAFMTWVPAYRKGVRDGARKTHKAWRSALYGKLTMPESNVEIGRAGKRSYYDTDSVRVIGSNANGHDV